MSIEHLFSLFVSQVVQVTILATLIWLITKQWAKDRPHLGHALWLLVLIKCVTPPIWYSPAGAFCWDWTTPEVVEVAHDESNQFVEQVESLPLKGLAAPISVHMSQNEAQEFASTQASAIASHEKSQATNASGAGLVQWALSIWIVGVCFSLAWAMLRSYAFVCWLKKLPRFHDSAIQERLVQLKKRLNVRHDVSLEIIDGSVGPAVFGLWRPRIVLPRMILGNSSSRQVDSLLAHELVHLRRGDLWWSAIQSIATCVFWFHPLVWFASQMVSRESERSCDEETVASLGCRPADYARCLLDVLERKQFLRVAPAVPGIRQVDITSARLERVMRFGNGIRKQTPLWIKFTMVLSAAVILPGAAKAIQVSPQETEQEIQEEQSPKVVVLETVETKVPILSDIPYVGRLFKNVGVVTQESSEDLQEEQEKDPQKEATEAGQEVTKTYNLSQLMNQVDFLPTDAKRAEFVKNWLTYPFPVQDPELEGKTFPQPIAVPKPEYHSPTVILDSTKQMMAVTTLPSVHERISGDIEYLGEFGFHQVLIETRFLSLEKQEWKKLGIQWQSAIPQFGNFHPRQVRGNGRGAEKVRSDQGLDGQFETGVPVQSNSYVQRNDPTLFCLLDDQQVLQLVQNTKGNSGSTLLQAPTILTLNGQEASVDDFTERPFVTALNPVEKDGMVAMQPQVTFVEEGTRLVQRPMINKDQSGVRLDCELTLSKILKVDTFEIPQPDDKTMSIQIPKIDVRKVTSSLEIPDAQTLALTMVNQEKDDSAQLVVLVTCRILEPGRLHAKADKSNGENVYGTPAVDEWSNDHGSAQPIAQPAVEFRPRLSIDSSGQGSAETNTAIKEALKAIGFEAEINGCVEFQFDGKTVHLRADQTVVRVNDDMQVEAGRCCMTLAQDDIRFQFEQGVRLDWPEVKATCERLVMHDLGEAKFTLEGKAMMELGTSKLRANRLSVNEADQRLLLEGAASWTGLDESNQSHRFEGQKIEYDLNGEALRLDESKMTFRIPLLPVEVDAEGQVLPAAYYLDDDIQYFPQGPEFKLQSEKDLLSGQQKEAGK